MVKYRVKAMMPNGKIKSGYVYAQNGFGAEEKVGIKFPGMRYAEIELA